MLLLFPVRVGMQNLVFVMIALGLGLGLGLVVVPWWLLLLLLWLPNADAEPPPPGGLRTKYIWFAGYDDKYDDDAIPLRSLALSMHDGRKGCSGVYGFPIVVAGMFAETNGGEGHWGDEFEFLSLRAGQDKIFRLDLWMTFFDSSLSHKLTKQHPRRWQGDQDEGSLFIGESPATTWSSLWIHTTGSCTLFVGSSTKLGGAAATTRATTRKVHPPCTIPVDWSIIVFIFNYY